MTGKDSSEACAIACQNCAVYSVFPSGMTSHSKIAQFKCECIGRLMFICPLDLKIYIPHQILFRVIKSRRMGRAVHITCMGESRGVYRVLVGKPEGKRPLRRLRRIWEDNIKMDLLEVGARAGSIWLRIGTGGGHL